MNKITTIVLVIVALIVGGIAGFLVERSRATVKMEAYKLVVQKQMNDFKMKQDEMTKQMTPTPSVTMMMSGTPEPSGMMMKK